MTGTLVNIEGEEVGDMNERGEFAMFAGFHWLVVKADRSQDIFRKVPLAQERRAGFGVVEIGMFLFDGGERSLPAGALENELLVLAFENLREGDFSDVVQQAGSEGEVFVLTAGL